MENAFDALKIAFAIIVFTLAIALSFSVISNIRHTSDVLFESSDKNKYYIKDLEGYTYVTAGVDDNRIVGVETIIPTIYRYYKENFGVTIFDSSLHPIARFDLETENIINNWQTNTDAMNAHIDYLNKYINPHKLILSVNDNPIWTDTFLKELYTDNGKISTPWIGSESKILERIKADIYGESATFNNQEYNGKNLTSDKLTRDKEFTEYFVFVPALKEDGTKNFDKTDKLEIIYVQK